MNSTVSSEFDFQSNYLESSNYRVHYIQEGEGDPIIFLHGVPSWSYLWRNVLPYLSSDACCYAFDFLGFGLSDKPDISYDYHCYLKTLTEFINALKLKNITLVMHGFGGIIGSIYAKNNPDNIKGLAYIESHICCQDKSDLISLPVQNVLSDLSDEAISKELILTSDYYLDKVMKPGFMGALSEKQWQWYQKPFKQDNSRLALWQYLNMLPYGEQENLLMNEIKDYTDWLQTCSIPKLLMVAMPGFIVSMKTVLWAKEHLKKLSVVDVGEGLHYIPECNPDIVGLAVHKWYEKL
jgi:haloalkane dehalogenase